jgi:hypothetical protein
LPTSGRRVGGSTSKFRFRSINERKLGLLECGLGW